jgi:predicted DsbA family dithiol-disulfide isomerase
MLANQESLTMRDLVQYAEELGLDVERFWEDLRARAHEPRVSEDVASADASGVAGTPSFFVNGTRYEGAYDADTLTRVVRMARTRARANELRTTAPR